MKRRAFLKNSIISTSFISFAPNLAANYSMGNNMFFKISLAEWSLNKALFSGDISNLDFPVKTKNDFGIDGVEYVSTFFDGTDSKYLNELLQRTKDHSVNNVLIMIDGEGNLGDTDELVRIQAVENHHKWVEAAKFLGCHSIRVNARGKGTSQEVADSAIDGLGRLSEYAAKENINVIVENHGGYSSNGLWLADVIKKVK